MRKFALVLSFVLISFLLNSAVLSAPYEPGDVLIAYGGDNVSERDTDDGSTNQNLSVSPSSFTTGNTLSGGGYLALDEDFNLYVSVDNYEGTGNTGIIKFDSSGNKVTAFDGNSDGGVDHRGLAVHDGVIYVARSSGIRRFNAETGDSITGIIKSGTSFRDVAFDSAGNLYGLRETEVLKWDAGSFTGSGTQVIGSGIGSDPRSIAFDNNDNLYATSNPSGGRVIQKFPKSDGAFGTPSDISTGLTSDKLIGLTYDSPIDTFYVSHTDTSTNQILKFTPSDTSTSAVPNTSGIAGARDVTVRPTPEPSTFILLGAGAAFAYFMKRRRRRK